MNTTKNTNERFYNELTLKMSSTKNMIIEAILYGFGQSILFYVVALLYYVGAVFIKNGDVSYGNFQKALMV